MAPFKSSNKIILGASSHTMCKSLSIDMMGWECR